MRAANRASAGGARSRATAADRADRRTRRSSSVFDRQFRRRIQQSAGDDRQPGSDLRQFHRVPARDSDIRKKHAGQQAGALVYIELADGSQYPQVGKIDFVDVTVNQGTDPSVEVRASFANPDRLLIDGQLVDVKVEGDKPERRW